MQRELVSMFCSSCCFIFLVTCDQVSICNISNFKFYFFQEVAWSNALASTSGSTTTPAPPTKQDPSASLSSLFGDNTYSGTFGMGGMLGLRAGIPKMPSFRVGFQFSWPLFYTYFVHHSLDL